MEHRIDTKGLACPLPVLKARRAIKDVGPGGFLIVEATDPASYIDFRHFCDTTGHTLEEWQELDGVYTYRIRKTA